MHRRPGLCGTTVRPGRSPPIASHFRRSREIEHCAGTHQDHNPTHGFLNLGKPVVRRGRKASGPRTPVLDSGVARARVVMRGIALARRPSLLPRSAGAQRTSRLAGADIDQPAPAEARPPDHTAGNPRRLPSQRRQDELHLARPGRRVEFGAGDRGHARDQGGRRRDVRVRAGRGGRRRGRPHLRD